MYKWTRHQKMHILYCIIIERAPISLCAEKKCKINLITILHRQGPPQNKV